MKQLDSVYGEASPSYSIVKQFRMAQVLPEDDERLGCPAEVLISKKSPIVDAV